MMVLHYVSYAAALAAFLFVTLSLGESDRTPVSAKSWLIEATFTSQRPALHCRDHRGALPVGQTTRQAGHLRELLVPRGPLATPLSSTGHTDDHRRPHPLPRL